MADRTEWLPDPCPTADVETVTKVFQLVQIELLHLMRVVFSLPGISHSVAFHRFGQHDRRLAPAVDGGRGMRRRP